MLWRAGLRTTAPSGPSGQYASAPPSGAPNQAMPVAIGSRQASNSPEWCMTTRSHCGTSFRLKPRNSGTSVWTASSWPGRKRLAYTIAGSTTGRPWIARRGFDQSCVLADRVDAGKQQAVTVRVLLAEVAGACRHVLGSVGGTDARLQEVAHRVVTGQEARPDLELDLLVLGVEPVRAELGAPPFDSRGDSPRRRTADRASRVVHSRGTPIAMRALHHVPPSAQ